ncbi:hypothetical protein AYO37_00405 [Opitutia bacterium SCGC AG-212-L18]|nr:hypothetical protein AYO37_00405 [Opitutae bacterium SCGC AG-212-L18]
MIPNIDWQSITENGSSFLYDLDSLRQHLDYMQERHHALRLWYACKANPLSTLLKEIAKKSFSFDVASPGELDQVLNIGANPENILVTGPAKNEAFLEHALLSGVQTFIIESENQYKTLEYLTKKHSSTPKILLRLQLDWKDKESSFIGGNAITPFGMDLPSAKALLPQIQLPLLGFHVFQWGNVLDLTKLEAIWRHIASICKEIETPIQVIDLGGGLGIPYNLNEKPLLWKDVNITLERIKNQFSIPEIWLELGRYVVGACGYYATKIVDRKTVRDHNLLICAGGINHIARPTLTHQHFPCTLARNSQSKSIPFNIHGPLCTALDFLGTHFLPEDIKIGDVLVFSQTGAYGFTESMPYFLCHELPNEIVLSQGALSFIRSSQTASTWLK